jgi:glucose/arabinose dehydrogenase
VQYVDRDSRLRVDELRRGSDGVRRVLDLGPVPEQHHGGQLQFGPDGLLYVSTGVGDEPEQAQALDRPGGKILRLDPRVPGAQPEVYALGLRNPWRFSFDRRTDALIIGDVGGSHAEEVDLIAPGTPAGTNFGFPAFEGRARRASGPPAVAAPPALVRTHAGSGWCAVTGGYVVRDRRLRRLRGRYVYGDLCSGRIRKARLKDGRLVRDRRARLRVPYLVSFGQDAAGRIYAVSFRGGVYRLRRP